MCIEIPEELIRRFQNRILSFYREHGRRLPWRETKDPYAILVSEIMLQQTQVSRVIEYYTRWMSRWPTVESLSEASTSEVLSMWMGLGYNNRGIRLQRAASVIVNEFDGDVLEAMNDFEKIPGVGPYTSKAVLIFSRNLDVVTVDTNIRRLFLFEFGLPEETKEKDLWELASRCLPKGQSRDWHNALMDYGALVWTAQKTGVKSRSKQSRFEGSDRQIRAQIIRLLLEEPMISQAVLENLKGGFEVDEKRLDMILAGLTRDGVIEEHDERYSIA